MNKLSLSLLLAGALPVCAATTVIDETFTAMPEKSKWKVAGDVTADQGLKMHAAGTEEGFANASISSTAPLPELNFSEKDVEVHLKDLTLGGEAPAPKQAFVIMLGSDKGSETAATAYLRICFNGDGTFAIDGASGPGGDASRHQTIVSKKVTYPIKSMKLLLNAKGYQLTLEDATGEQSAAGEWDAKYEISAWNGSSPALVVKTVRRPSPGTADATLGGLTILNP